MKSISRRLALKGALAGAGGWLAGCGGGTDAPASIQEVAPPSTLAAGTSLEVALAPSASTAAPITLKFDRATPHQISINAPQTRTLAADATARVYYRVAGGALTWVDGGLLYRCKTVDDGLYHTDPGLMNGFAGWVLDCKPGTSYEVRVDVTESGVTTSATSTTKTRALPAEKTAQTKTCTPATFAATMSGAVAGDVIVLQNGTYTLSSYSWTSPGQGDARVYIRGQSRTGVVLVDTTDHVFTLNGNHCIIENLTIRGSKIDSGTAAASAGIVMSGSRKTNVTVRHVTFDGVDKGIKAYDPVNGLLVYDCEFLGNNPWFTGDGDDDGRFWNDSGVSMPGQGNCVWNCTFSGFGDVVKLTMGSGNTENSRACYVHHNWIKWSGDDFFEADDTGGNTCAYNNIVANTTTAISCAPNRDGPVGLVRNVFINQIRHPLKLNGLSRGARIWNNTFVLTTKKTGSDFGLYCPQGDAQYGFDFRNNLITYRGSSSQTLRWDMATVGAAIDYNGWYPNRQFQVKGYTTSANLSAFKAANPALMQHDRTIERDPFATDIALGANYTSRYDGNADVTLQAGSKARNAGTPIPGVTDGYSGAAPDLGAFISGQAFGAVGCAWAPWTT